MSRQELEFAKDAFDKRKELLTGSVRVDLVRRLVGTLVWPAVLYGWSTSHIRETWTMRKEEMGRLRPLRCGCGEE